MKTQIKSERKPGGPVKFFGERNEASSWGFTASSRASSQRFVQILQCAITSVEKQFTTASHLLGLLVARLVCLDGVSLESLQKLDIASFRVYQMFGQAVIEWREVASNRIERRILSMLTISAWESVKDSSTFNVIDTLPIQQADKGESLNQLQQALTTWLADNGFYSGASSALSKLGEDQLCWLAEVLPGALFAHCAAKFQLNALPRSCWARLETRRALASSEADLRSEGGREPVTLRVAEFVGEVNGKRVDVTLIRAALHILSQSHPDGVDAHTKRQWVTELEKLPLHLLATNPQTVIVVGWIIYMCEYGTLNTNNVACSTIRAYAQRAIMELAQGLSKFKTLQGDPGEWPPDNLYSVYGLVLNQSSTGNRPVCAAALKNFQHYLEDIFDTDILQDYVYRNEEGYEPTVHAEIVWDHEIQWCIQSCSGASDARIGEIAKIMLAIARECPVRYQDLSRITIRNVAFDRDSVGRFCELEVARDAYRGRLKTDSSQRRLLVRSPFAIELLEHWLTERRCEGAPADAYLFGDSTDDTQRYRPTAVQGLLNRLVKAASGCSTMRFHNLRHSVISRRTAEILSSCPLADVIPLEVLAAAAGQASPITTLRTYSHVYEEPLRMWLNLGLRKHCTLSSAMLADTYASTFPLDRPILPNSLVQAASRHRISLQDYWWNQVDRHALPSGIALAPAPFTWADPTALPSSTRAAIAITIPIVADALVRLSRGTSDSVVERVLNIQQGRIEPMRTQLKRWLQDVYSNHFPRISRRQGVDMSWSDLLKSMHIDLEGMQSPIWSSLSSTLERGMDSKTLIGAVEHWVTHGRRIYFPLLPTHSARPLITLLGEGNVNRDHIRAIVQQPRPVDKPLTQLTLLEGAVYPGEASANPALEISRLFEEEMRIEPRFESTSWRVDRPMAYMKINPHADKERTAGKSDQSGALKAWLVAIKAHQYLTAEISTDE